MSRAAVRRDDGKYQWFLEDIEGTRGGDQLSHAAYSVEVCGFKMALHDGDFSGLDILCEFFGTRVEGDALFLGGRVGEGYDSESADRLTVNLDGTISRDGDFLRCRRNARMPISSATAFSSPTFCTMSPAGVTICPSLFVVKAPASIEPLTSRVITEKNPSPMRAASSRFPVCRIEPGLLSTWTSAMET